MRITNSAGAHFAGVKTGIMHLIGIAKATGFIQLPVKFSHHLLFGMDFARIVIQKEGVVPRPVQHVIYQPIHARRHLGRMRKWNAQKDAAIVVADIDAFGDGLLTGGRRKSLAQPGPVVNQKLRVIHEIAAPALPTEAVTARGQPLHAVITDRFGNRRIAAGIGHG